jgi:DNA-binding CsgD family transcriptional regulator
VPVGVHVEGEPRPPPGVDLSGYRIVQEALTDVVRHAAPATAELTLRYSPGEVVIEVTDNGRTPLKPPEKLLDAVRVVASGQALLAPTVTRRLIEAFTARPDEPPSAAPAALETLTGREREVLREVSRGLSNAGIAERLHMSGATAKTHVSRLLMKLAARDRAQLVVVAYECGLASASAVADENASRRPGRT